MFVCKKCQCLRQNEDICRGFRAEQILSVQKWSVHTHVLSVLPFCPCSSDLWGGLGRRDAAVWAIALCSKFLSVHKSSLFYPSICVISSHTGPLCSSLLCFYLFTHVVSVLPFCLCSYLFTHKSSVLPICLCSYLFTHTQGLPILPLCLCSYLFTHKSLFYPSVLSVHTRHLCSTCLCYLFTHKSSLFCPSVCVVCSHMSSLFYPSVCPCSYLFTAKSLFYPSMFLSVHTQIIPVLPICVLICSHTVICSTLLSVFFSVHTQVHLVLPHCLCSYLFTHKSLFYPSVCLCSSDLWGGPGRRDAAVWAIQGTAQPPASVARVTYHQLCWHSVTGSAHCPSRGPRGMYWSWELDVCQNGYMFDNRIIY